MLLSIPIPNVYGRECKLVTCLDNIVSPFFTDSSRRIVPCIPWYDTGKIMTSMNQKGIFLPSRPKGIVEEYIVEKVNFMSDDYLLMFIYHNILGIDGLRRMTEEIFGRIEDENDILLLPIIGKDMHNPILNSKEWKSIVSRSMFLSPKVPREVRILGYDVNDIPLLT